MKKFIFPLIFLISNQGISLAKERYSVPEPIPRQHLILNKKINTSFKQGESIKEYEKLTLIRGTLGSDGIGYQDKQCLINKTNITKFEADDCWSKKISKFIIELHKKLFHCNFYQVEAILSRMYHKGIDNFWKTNIYKVIKIIDTNYHMNLNKVPNDLKVLLIYEWLDDNQIKDEKGKISTNHKFFNGFQIRMKNELKFIGNHNKDFLNLIKYVENKMDRKNKNKASDRKRFERYVKIIKNKYKIEK